MTGANGFIGTNLCNELHRMGFSVTALVRIGADTSMLSNDCHIISCDYSDIPTLTQTLSDYEIVIHLAALTRANDFKTLYETNVSLTNEIVQIVNKSERCKQLVFISSQAAVGPAYGKQAVKEDTKPKPISWYGMSKYKAEQKITQCEKNWTIIRPASVYGEGDKDFLVYFQLINIHLSPIPGSSTKFLSLIYVKDLINMIEKCLDNCNVFGKIIHASDNKVYTMELFIDTLKSVMNKKCVKIKIPNKLIMLTGNIVDFFSGRSAKPPVFNKQKALEISQNSWLLDSTESLNLLGIEMTSNLEDNLRQTYQWYKERKYIL